MNRPERESLLGVRLARVLIVGVLAATPAMARQAASNSKLPQLIASLDAKEFADRDAASEQIKSDTRITLDEIGRELGRADLTLEQRRRLGLIYKDRFFSLPRPAIGIRFDYVEADERGVTISPLNDKFPAVKNKLVQAGDIIVSLDGQSLAATPDELALIKEHVNLTDTEGRRLLPVIISSFLPGETVKAEILRLNPVPDEIKNRPLGGPLPAMKKEWARERVAVDLPLGRREDLTDIGQQGIAFRDQNFVVGGSRTLFEAMGMRLDRQGIAITPPPVVSLKAEEVFASADAPGLTAWDMTRILGLADSTRNPSPPGGIQLVAGDLQQQIRAMNRQQQALLRQRLGNNQALRQVIIDGPGIQRRQVFQPVAPAAMRAAITKAVRGRTPPQATTPQEDGPSAFGADGTIRRIAALREQVRVAQAEAEAAKDDPSVRDAALARVVALRAELDTELGRLGSARQPTRVTTVNTTPE